jgi:uncharacterized membrane protein
LPNTQGKRIPALSDQLVEIIGSLIEMLGILIIGADALYIVIISLVHLFSGKDRRSIYRVARIDLSRAILLGLEFLVAGDIIRTVAVVPTFSSVGLLAAVVLIRTFLSFSLEIEISGKLPWKRGSEHLS